MVLYNGQERIAEPAGNASASTLRVAVCSSSVQSPLGNAVKERLNHAGWNCELFDGDPNSMLAEFHPDYAISIESTNTLSFDTGNALQKVQQRWEWLRTNSKARIIQCNYAVPDHMQPSEFAASVIRCNAELASMARDNGHVLLCDLEAISSWLGRTEWFARDYPDEISLCSSACLPSIADSIVGIIRAAQGRVTKCIVLDLDNTLWGGVVGDDGPLGVAIGAHGDGEPFYHFQQYLRSLKQRGILLAVCSKNEMANALAPFTENPDMVLKRDDITVFVANWENKGDNIRKIRDILEIGLDSMVFLDDNPFERNLVRQLVPEVNVPDLPEDPSDYVKAVSTLNLFEATSFSAEDAARAELYKTEGERREVQSSFSDIGEYLRSLGMQMDISRFTTPKLARIAQLLQRSNQFNLTTHRYSEAECEALMLDRSTSVPLCASLSDRFGDHGLISIVVLKITDNTLLIADWLMSCRVLVRGVEQTLMNYVVDTARHLGSSTIRGEYFPTAKNSMVKEFYAQFGFRKVSDNDGRSIWELSPDEYRINTSYVEVKEAEAWNAKQ